MTQKRGGARDRRRAARLRAPGCGAAGGRRAAGRGPPRRRHRRGRPPGVRRPPPRQRARLHRQPPGRPGRHRTVGAAADDGRPDADRRPPPDHGRDQGAGRATVDVSAIDPRAHRLHAPAVHALSGPDGPRERRLRRQHVRDALAAAPTADAGGPEAARAVGRPRPTGERDVGRDAAPARARLCAGPRTDAAVPRRADRRYRPDPPGQGLGRAPPPARLRGDGPRHDAVRGRRGGLRPGGPHRRGPARGDGRAGRASADGPGRRRDRRRDRDDVRRQRRRLRRRRPRDQPARPARVRCHGERLRGRPAGGGRGDQGGRHRDRLRAGAAAVVRRRLRDPRCPRPGRGETGIGGPGARGMSLVKALTRILAFVGKEIVEVVRRPGALASLILGPFLILALFGAGYSGYRRPLDTVVVVPPDSGLPTDVASYHEISGAGLEVTQVTTDEAAATQRLQAGHIDVVLVAPGDVEQNFRAGRQSTIQVRVNVTDPVDQNYTTFLARALEREVNRIIVERIAQEGQAYALNAGAADAAQIPPSVVAAPTKAAIDNIAPAQPTVVQYFGTAVLALVLQHMAVTLIALSVIRERTTGLFELFRVSPIRTGELVVGKVTALGDRKSVV